MHLRPSRARWLVLIPALCAALAAQTTDSAGIPERRPAPVLPLEGADSLERPDRDEQERPDDLLRALALEPGDVVADVGCGTGFLARRAARLVGQGGTVYCQDIQRELLDQMRELAAAEGVSGIVPIVGTPDDPNLPKGEVDWLLLADAYHEFANPGAMLANMRPALAPGGRIALIEARAEDNSAFFVHPAHRMSVRQVLAEWKPAGYRLVDLREDLPAQHLFIFQPADAAGGAPAVTDLPLAAAIRTGAVEAQPRGAGERSVTIRIRRTGTDRLVVTTGPGEYFASPTDRTRDMISTRDGAVALFDDEWHDLVLLAAGTKLERQAPDSSVALQFEPDRAPPLRRLMYAMQAAGYPFIVAQAALAIALDDLPYEKVEPLLQGGPISPQHAAAVAMVAASRAGVDVASRKILAARDALIPRVPDPNLRNSLLLLGH